MLNLLSLWILYFYNLYWFLLIKKIIIFFIIDTIIYFYYWYFQYYSNFNLSKFENKISIENRNAILTFSYLFIKTFFSRIDLLLIITDNYIFYDYGYKRAGNALINYEIFMQKCEFQTSTIPRFIESMIQIRDKYSTNAMTRL